MFPPAAGRECDPFNSRWPTTTQQQQQQPINVVAVHVASSFSPRNDQQFKDRQTGGNAPAICFNTFSD
jgi:hypothetical protein